MNKYKELWIKNLQINPVDNRTEVGPERTQRAYNGGNNPSIRLNLENLCYDLRYYPCISVEICILNIFTG